LLASLQYPCLNSNAGASLGALTQGGLK